MNESSSIRRFMDIVANMPISRVAIVAAVLTGIYYMMVYDDGSALQKKIQAAKTQLSSENQKKQETQKVVKKEQQMKADVELVAKKFEEVRSKIPVEFLESELREVVQQLAAKNNLKTIKTERRAPPGIRPAANIKDGVSAENLVQQVTLVYEFEGQYNNISKFVNEISSSEKVIKIGDFNLIMSRGGSQSQQKERNDLTFRASIIGYKQTPPELLKEAEPKAKPATAPRKKPS